MSERAARRPERGSIGALLWYWGPLLLWLAAILLFSGEAMSAGRTSRFVEPLIRWLVPDASPETVYVLHVAVRKCAHLAEYAMLALLAFRAVRAGRSERWRPRWALAAFGIAAGCACVDEFRQSLTSTRTGTVDDVLVDVAGAAAAMLALHAYARIHHRGRREHGA